LNLSAITRSILEADITQFIDRSRVGRLATVDSECKPHLVPVVFAFDGRNFFIPIDEKRKKTPAKPDKLKRVRNIRKNPSVALLIDRYSEDWTKLAFVMVQGKASLARNNREASVQVKSAYKELAKKYPQYRNVGLGNTCIVIKPERVVSWKNSASK
jgi:PPOX class probable F420-dependent enzyme